MKWQEFLTLIPGDVILDTVTDCKAEVIDVYHAGDDGMTVKFLWEPFMRDSLETRCSWRDESTFAKYKLHQRPIHSGANPLSPLGLEPVSNILQRQASLEAGSAAHAADLLTETIMMLITGEVSLVNKPHALAEMELAMARLGDVIGHQPNYVAATLRAAWQRVEHKTRQGNC